MEDALLALYSQQTPAEQAGTDTHESNGRGFNKYDAPFMSSLAEQVLGIGWYTDRYGAARERRSGRALTPKQLDVARKKLTRYAEQIARIYNSGNDYRKELQGASGHLPEILVYTPTFYKDGPIDIRMQILEVLSEGRISIVDIATALRSKEHLLRCDGFSEMADSYSSALAEFLELSEQ